MLLIKDVIKCLKKSDEPVTVVLKDGVNVRRISLDEWERNLKAFDVLDCEALGLTWTFEIGVK